MSAIQLAFIVSLTRDACALAGCRGQPHQLGTHTRASNASVQSGVKEAGQHERWVKGGIMRFLQAVTASALASLAVVGCASAGGAHLTSAAPAARPMSKTASAPPSAQAMRCRAGVLDLRPGAYVSPMTGEHAVIYALTNHGSVTCTLDGYPQVALYSAPGIALPFRYTNGGGAYATHNKPATVVLAPGASAYVLVAKHTGAISVPCAPRPPSSSPCQRRVASRSWAVRLPAGQEAWACPTAAAARMTLARSSPSPPRADTAGNQSLLIRRGAGRLARLAGLKTLTP
jgi:Protein of unknown function (DUF4232)